jgi:hypothetical protein
VSSADKGFHYVSILRIIIIDKENIHPKLELSTIFKLIKTSTPSEEASQSIRGAITDTGQFLQNASQKVAGSKSAQTIVNESSDVLGNATVATKKYFSK